MTTLPEIKAAAAALSSEQQQELFLSLAGMSDSEPGAARSRLGATRPIILIAEEGEGG